VTDLLLANAFIVDGMGTPGVFGSVAVQGDRIELIVPPGQPEPAAGRRIDVSGRVIAPGFVDVHNHSDVTPFVEPGMHSMLRQGVTTVVVGNCGGSAYPLAGAEEMAIIAGAHAEDLRLSWDTYGRYLERVQERRPALNLAGLIGHGTLRLAVMGGTRRGPARDEMRAMQRLLEGAVDAGAVGLSTGLIYAPGLHASTGEIVELASVMRGSGAVYASHIRGEGERVSGAVAECIEIGRRAGVPSHVSHLKLETSMAWGRSDELLAQIDTARDGGADVSADQYPYTAWESELASCLPPWASASELPDLLADRTTRERLRRSVEEGETGWQSSVKGVGWDRIVVVAHAGARGHTGTSIAAIASERGIDPVQTAFDLLIADPHTSVIGHAMIESDVRSILARDDVMVASDGLAVSPDGPLGRFNVHPRYYGTFPRVLGPYVRDEALLTLETAVRKMTSLPASRFGLVDRGRIAGGAFADLVVFDPERIADRATFSAPHSFAEGIDLVVVNGRIAWDGTRTHERSGRALRRGSG
jgi:N-acyl-D-aspartate/D-glutamate deacylase